MNFRSTIFVLLLLALASCRDPPDYPDEPVIEFVSMSKNTMIQSPLAAAGDFVFVNVSFTDGDGNLGSNNFNDSTRVYYSDMRFTPALPQPPISIPLIPELGSGNGISGDITIKIPTTCCLYPGVGLPCEPLAGFPTDTVSYEIYILDRDDNKSNVIQTPPIVLICQ
ncbi:MAG: hypothetical protein AB8F74_01220 [Saprospiraceae bacterium]